MTVGFRVLASGDGMRIGSCPAQGREEIEILVRLWASGNNIDLPRAKACLALLDRLKERGYDLSVQDGWWVAGERSVPMDMLRDEIECLKELFNSI